MTTISRIIAAARAGRRYRRTLRALSALSDLSLQDVGFVRDDLGRIARSAAGGA